MVWLVPDNRRNLLSGIRLSCTADTGDSVSDPYSAEQANFSNRYGSWLAYIFVPGAFLLADAAKLSAVFSLLSCPACRFGASQVRCPEKYSAFYRNWDKVRPVFFYRTLRSRVLTGVPKVSLCGAKRYRQQTRPLSAKGCPERDIAGPDSIRKGNPFADAVYS